MPRIFIVYGTTAGHTAKIAHVLADTLRSSGSEYTDWNELRAFARGFGRMVSGEPGPRLERQELLPGQDAAAPQAIGSAGTRSVRRGA